MKTSIIDQATAVVFDHWVTSGEGMTITEIAKAINVSPATLRKHTNATPMGIPSDVCVCDVERPITSIAYPDQTIGTRRVNGWRPTDAMIRREIHRLRAHVPESKRAVQA